MLKHPPSLLLLATVSLTTIVAAAPPPSPAGPGLIDPRGASCSSDPDYVSAIQRTADMVWDEGALRLAQEHGLDLVNLTWEDTGRYYGSSVGPNISDLTIQVQHQLEGTRDCALTLMPVIRYPNFTDLTADIDPDDFYLLVGNERGDDLERITLTEYLRHFRRYLSVPDSWASREDSLLAGRDSHVLVSAQAAFLPVPQEGIAEFNPVIFNYQSYQGDPAVLTIVATREGTSTTVIDNTRDAFPAGWSWGQRLFFNQDGERASFTGERLSDFVSTRPVTLDSPEAAGESGLNMVLIIQVPLRQKVSFEDLLPSFGAMAPMAESAQRSDVEAAVIGHGAVEGPFTEIDGLAIRRDGRFPIRVTVQFYKATSDGIVTESDMQAIADQIDRVYEDGDYVGSLVVDGPSDRPTEYDGPKDEPPGWWQAFWTRFEDNIGLDRDGALDLLRELGVVAWRWILAMPRE
ncbi:MAG TPA: hypothetical protein VIH84_02485 [Candidatus Methylomirabilis sp.]